MTQALDKVSGIRRRFPIDTWMKLSEIPYAKSADSGALWAPLWIIELSAHHPVFQSPVRTEDGVVVHPLLEAGIRAGLLRCLHEDVAERKAWLMEAVFHRLRKRTGH